MQTNLTPKEAARKFAANKINQGFNPEGLYQYLQPNGKPYWRIRLKHPKTGQKIFWPMHQTDTGEFVLKEPKFESKKPLYCSREIINRLDEPVWVHEGEKCVHAAMKLGLLSTTSGGDTSAQLADFSILAGREVYIWPDNVAGGLKYGEEVKQILLALKCSVKVIDIAKLNIPEKGDIVDWLNANPSATKDDIYALPLIDDSPQNEPAQEWLEPEPIKNELLPVEQLPSAIIPEPYRDFAVDVAERMQCPIDYIAVSLLIVTATVVGAGVGIRPKKEDSWLVIANLWACIVGRPGMMKTPATNEVLRYLDYLQDEAKQVYEEKLKDYYIELEIYKCKKEAIKSQIVTAEREQIKNGDKAKGVSPEHLKTCLKELKEPSIPIWCRFKTNDSTIEKLNELLSENPRGLLVFRDEIMGWLRTFEKTGHENDRAFFLETWNGNTSQTSDRIGRGTTHAKNLCLSVFGTTQPDKLIRYLYGALHGENDGLIQRLQLLIFPDEPKSWQLVDKKPVNDAHKKVNEIVRKLVDMNFSQYGAAQENDEIPYFRFSDEAQNLFYQWWEEVRILRKPCSPYLFFSD